MLKRDVIKYVESKDCNLQEDYYYWSNTTEYILELPTGYNYDTMKHINVTSDVKQSSKKWKDIYKDCKFFIENMTKCICKNIDNCNECCGEN